MRISKLTLFFIFFIQLGSVSAQTNFLPGYYVTANRDTVNGFIEIRSEDRNYKSCVFKARLNQSVEAINLYPKDILGFTVDGQEFYQRDTIKNIDKADQLVFFKLIVKGKLSLLGFQKTYFARKNGKLYEINQARGPGVMSMLMRDCSSISEKTLARELSKVTPDYISLVKKYNWGMGSEAIEYHSVKTKLHVNVGVQASVAATRLGLSNSLADANLGFQSNYNLGGYFAIFIPRASEKVRLMIDLVGGKTKHYGYFKSANTNNDLFIDYTYLKLPIYFRRQMARMFVDFGMQNQFILSQHEKWRVEQVNANTIVTNNGSVTPLSNWTAGYLVGVGVKYELSTLVIRTSARFSQTISTQQIYRPNFLSGELVMSVQLK